MTDELRCGNKLHGVMVEDDVVEVACSSQLCGAGRGVAVRHRFRISTRQLISTKRYKSPERRKDSEHSSGARAAVRHA